MNRSQRREAERKSSTVNLDTAEYRITKQIQNKVSALVIDQRKDATRQACVVITSVFALSLNKLYEFGEGRINKLLDDVRFQLECIADGHLNGDDIAKWAIEKGIKL